MKREYIDVFHIEARHDAIHARLLNWAEWARVRPHYAMSPMFMALGCRSNSRQWHAPEVKDTVDILDAAAIEKLVSGLPDRHAESLRWFYVYQWPSVDAYRRKRGYTRPCWPGCNLGVRAPLPAETALSWAEVHHALAVGLLGGRHAS